MRGQPELGLLTNQTCTYDPTDTAHFPYEFRNVSGHVITQGFLRHVPGYSEPVCIFNASTCAAGDVHCCGETKQLETASNIWWIIMIFFYAPFIVMQCFFWHRRRRKREQMLAQGRTEAEIDAEAAAAQSRMGLAQGDGKPMRWRRF